MKLLHRLFKLFEIELPRCSVCRGIVATSRYDKLQAREQTCSKPDCREAMRRERMEFFRQIHVGD